VETAAVIISLPKEVEMNKAFHSFLILIVLLAAAATLAEEAVESPQPTAEHKELARWLGSWSGSGEIKPSPFGPGGAMTWSEDCSWFGGGEFHVLCKSKGEGPTGPMVGLGIVGYNPGKNVYTHYGVDSSGWSGYAEGTRSGDTWTFTSTETVEGATFHSRFAMIMESPTKMTFTWEMSEDGESWTTMMDGVSTKR
jgi:hypothetical protein